MLMKLVLSEKKERPTFKVCHFSRRYPSGLKDLRHLPQVYPSLERLRKDDRGEILSSQSKSYT